MSDNNISEPPTHDVDTEYPTAGGLAAPLAPVVLRSNDTKSIQEVTQYVQSLLQNMQDKFQTMSDQIINRIDEMGNRVDELEKNITELMTQAGVENIIEK